MKNTEHDPRLLEHSLRGYRLAAPSPELKARVLGAARAAWNVAPLADGIPWTGPMLRFAACLVLAALPVVWAHVAPSPRPDRVIVKVQESPAARPSADLWAAAGRPELVRMYLQQAAKTETHHAELLAGYLQALAAEAGILYVNGS